MTGQTRRRRGILTRDDLKLWAHVAAGVTPMRGKALPVSVPEETVPEPNPPAGSPPPVPARRPEPARPPAPPPLAPLERRLRQRLSRGQRPVDAVIDLHGMRQAEAHGALIAFITRAHASGRSLVLVITGKGGESRRDWSGGDERGVLKRLVPHWLADPAMRRHVIGFEEAARDHGGSGALYVRIRRPRERS